MKSNFRYFKISLLLLAMSLLACEKHKDGQHDHSMDGKTDSVQHKHVYTCPMPEDSVFSDKPGNCPKCGMELIKVENSEAKSGYTCPMHPEVVSDKPGKCPKCNMDLVPIAEREKTDTIASLIEPTNHLVISKLKPIAPSPNKGSKSIMAEGYLTYDPNNASSISARVSGRIEKLYVRYNFQRVSKGEKLLDIYSHELLTAQNEFLYLEKSKDSSDRTARNATRQKLMNLGMSEGSISQIKSSGKANPYVSIYASSSGHVHFLNGNTDISSHALGLSASTSMDNKGTESEDDQVLREGDYVKTGDLLFTIADQSSIWAVFKLLPSDISSIKKGETVEVSINNETHEGRVDFVEKSFEDFYTVRVYLECDDHSKLRIGTLVKGYISVKPVKTQSIWVPAMAVLDLGKSRTAVFLRKELGYAAKTVTTGIRTTEWVEVTHGLSLSDSIAPVAGYLVDSEAFIVTEE